MNEPVIELLGLTVRFGRRDVLKRLTGRFESRSIGLLGPNGAGKTTLIHTLLGFHAPSAGTAKLLGREIRGETRWIRRHIGYMPENEAFIAGMTAVRLVRMMAELSGLPPKAALERAHEALFYVGLGEARYRTVESFSLGMKQQVKLAQAIVHGPQLLFLDEPTNGLDPPHRQRMIRLVNEIRESGTITLVLSSHLLRDVEECCEDVLVLRDGHLAAACNLEEERRANKRLIELEALGDRSGFEADLLELGCEIATHGNGRLKTVLPEEVGVRDLYRIAARHDVRLRRVDFKRDSLEDIFLRAMEGDHGGL
ncbi:MAG: ABC transporter ATP-binding protein [Acidobacteriota bacterium]|nr:ABC transporter ATP-binding protein [Acidobacteriota bacterium]